MNVQSQAFEADGALTPPRVAIVVLTYGHADDAITALKSLRSSLHRDHRIVLVDNASPDGAYETVRNWAESENGLPFQELSPRAQGMDFDAMPSLTLIQSGANLGYAGGNNVALNWLLRSKGWTHVWIVNPDIEVEPETLSALIQRAGERPDAGIIGARICGNPGRDRVLNYGGGQLRWLYGVGRSLGLGAATQTPVDVDQIEHALDYVVGCSMFIQRAFLEEVGLMEEGYFLYNEEFDWCLRRGRFSLAYAHDAIVYHKLGASIGSSSSRASISPFSLFWNIRNRFRFTKRFNPQYLPTVYLGCWYEAVRMAATGNWRNVWVILRTMHGLQSRP